MRGNVDMAEKALTWLKDLPRLSLGAIRNDPGVFVKHERGRGQHGGFRHGAQQKGSKQRMNYMRVGYENGSTPFYLRFQKEPYYKGHLYRRELPRISLLQLQKFIDTDRIDTDGLIDLAAIIRTGLFHVNCLINQWGVELIEEGMNKFSAKVDIEVQWASEPVIAAIERLGGSVTMAYYDLQSVMIMNDPVSYFKKGQAIPRRMLPPENAIKDYADPKRRGYLADPQEIEYERAALAQKYGYEYIKRDPPIRKDPRQIFLGLEPGWVINLKDKTILKPKNQELVEYYRA